MIGSRVFLPLLVLAAAFCASGPALAAKRVALVIGNDNYENLPKLEKAVADANAYAGLLEAQGFDQVILKTDLTRAEADEALADFFDAIEPGDTAVFAYSGHGWSDGTQNYLVATDAPKGGRQELLARISIPLRNGATGILDDMDRRGATLKVAIIDACRDNPFTTTGGTRTTALARGLTRVEPPSGTFVIFSAGTGQQALDGLASDDPAPNSVFTRVFVPLVESGLTLQEATKEAQEKVVALAGSIDHDQRPAYYDEVLGRACLFDTCLGGAEKAASPEDAAAAYQAASAVNTAEGWNAFLKHHPDGFYADLARAALAKLGAAEVAALPPPAAVDSQSARDCDRLGAIALDPAKPVTLRGIDRPSLVTPEGAAACRQAVADHPDIARFKTQLGFAELAADKKDAARALFTEAAEAGHSVAMFGLGVIDRDSDPVASRTWMKKAQEAGYPLALLASAYWTKDEDGAVAREKAVALVKETLLALERAAAAGDPDAPAAIALVQLDGEFIPEDPVKAGPYLVDSVKKGSHLGITTFASKHDRLSAAERLAVETFLAERGLDPGPVDGVVDDQTRAALDKLDTAGVN